MTKYFNEDSRVKLPALIHFTRLGYDYQSKKGVKVDPTNNIFIDIFKESICSINNYEYTDNQLNDLIKEIGSLTDNNMDKGKSFYERLTSFTGVKLIDLEVPNNNQFHVVSELTFRGNREEFRPDITVLINGIPLAFLEVKKPNNRPYTNKKGVTKYGIQAEFNRMQDRFSETEFTHFFNQLQIICFTNNQPYDDGQQVPLQGSFYSTPNFVNTTYNHFREEQEIAVNEFVEDKVLEHILYDNNSVSYENTTEFNDNIKVSTYANSFITSIFSKERLIYLIRYGIVYVDSQMSGLNKHIIRYPQYFALNKLKERIENNDLRRGVLWHTQGSGKTAFSYFATNVLRDYFQKQKIITKFYFVTDRLDLLIQASTEFSDRGMTIAAINSKDDFEKNLKSKVVMSESQQRGKYKDTMNVVNIQKFPKDPNQNYSAPKGIQRIYFIDEVHRGYKLQGVFLSNLLASDPNGIFIGLTGTPIIKEESKTTNIFNDGYIHKYYYNKSIADGYTLKIKKENISMEFKNDMKKLLGIDENKEIPSQKWVEATSTEIFINQLCPYIESDFENFITIQKDKSLGFMVVTSNSKQARLIQNWFSLNSSYKAALVLYDEDGNEENQKEFRGKRDRDTGETVSDLRGVVVYNMLLTGFDAPRLKRLYLLRKIKEHSLLQTLARVNRPYKNMRYGYIVDFVDITEEYEQTNQRYIAELKKDLVDDELNDVSDMFVDVEKVKGTIRHLENKLFTYMGNIENNLEAFSKQIEVVSEKEVREIKANLEEYRGCYNELRMSHEDVSRIPIDRINKAYTEICNRIGILIANRTLTEDVENEEEIDYTQLIVYFLHKGEVELDFTTENDILEVINKINNAFSANVDKDDKRYQALKDELRRIIKAFKSNANSTVQIRRVLEEFDQLLKDILLINEENNNLVNRYKGDDSCMRIHKRLREQYGNDEINQLNDKEVYQIMLKIIEKIDQLMLQEQPTENIIIRELLKPVRNVFREHDYTLSRRQVEDVIYLFIDDKFKKY